MSWQHIHEYPIDYHKIWVATSPVGKTSTYRSKGEAMQACEAGISKRAAIAGRARQDESGKLAEMKAMGNAQIASGWEMSQ